MCVCVCVCARKGKRDLHSHHLESLISPVTVRPERGNQGLRCHRADVVTHCDDCCKKCHLFFLKRLYLLPYTANAGPLFVIQLISRREHGDLASQRVSSCKSAAPKILTAGWRCVLLKWGLEGETLGHVRAGVTYGDKERNENKDRGMRWRKVSRCALLCPSVHAANSRTLIWWVVCMSGSKYKCVLLSFRSKQWGPERVGCHAAHRGGRGQGVGLLPAGELWWVAHSPGEASQAARLRRGGALLYLTSGMSELFPITPLDRVACISTCYMGS